MLNMQFCIKQGNRRYDINVSLPKNDVMYLCATEWNHVNDQKKKVWEETT